MKEVAPADSTPVLDELASSTSRSPRSRLDLELDVLAWWKAKETKWPALAKMVKQYFAAPASSAGVERVFSAAGKMHSDLQKSPRTRRSSIHSLQRSTLTDHLTQSVQF